MPNRSGRIKGRKSDVGKSVLDESSDIDGVFAHQLPGSIHGGSSRDQVFGSSHIISVDNPSPLRTNTDFSLGVGPSSGPTEEMMVQGLD